VLCGGGGGGVSPGDPVNQLLDNCCMVKALPLPYYVADLIDYQYIQLRPVF